MSKSLRNVRFPDVSPNWQPQAFKRPMPTLGGETILQLKASTLVATITVI